MEEHNLKWQASALDFLTRYSEEGDNFLSRVVTGRDMGDFYLFLHLKSFLAGRGFQDVDV
jgi:hypothetical protein